MPDVNKKLVPLKLFLFCSYGALGCLWPFLTVHMRSLGLTLEEAAIINLVLPFTSLLGPPIAGAVADKLGRRRLVLVLCLVLAGVSYSCLLFVPPVQRNAPHAPAVSFACGKNDGYISLQRCDRRCELPDGNYAIELSDCKITCLPQLPGPSHSTGLEPEDEDEIIGMEGDLSDEVTLESDAAEPKNGTTTAISFQVATPKPMLCFHQNPPECHVYNASGLEEKLPLYFNALQPSHAGEDACHYPLARFTKAGADDIFNYVRCQGSYPLLNEECHVQCKVKEISEKKLLLQPRCVHIQGDPYLTFWVYFLIRGIAELFPASCLALLDATVFCMVRQHRGHYSKQILFGIVAIGIFPPLVGFLNDYFGTDAEHPDYTPAFIVFDVLLLLAAILASLLEMEPGEHARSLCRHISRLLQHAEVLALFFVVFVIGTQFGFLETFLYWYLETLGATHLLLGLTITAGVIPSFPFLYFGDRIVKICGNANLIIVALFMYSIRFTGYAYIPGPWWALQFECLEVFTLYLMWVSTVTYCARLSPSMMIGTTMALTTVLHYNAGRGVGALAGGYVMDQYGAQLAYQGCAIFSGCSGLIYFSVYHFYLKNRRTAIFIEPVANGHSRSPGWEQHPGNGEAQSYKPMLDDTKS